MGKTTITANLGLFLARAGKRVCIADADFGLNNLDVIAGVENSVVYDITDCIEGRCRARQALIQSPANKNLYVMPSINSFAAKSADLDNLKELIEGLSGGFDFVLIDCPAGMGGGFHRAVSASDEALVVVTSQISSLRDADKVLSVLRGYSLKSVRIIANMVRGDLIADKALLPPEKTEEILGTEMAGVVPCDDRIMLGTLGALLPESDGARAFRTLASNIIKNKRRIFDYLSGYTGFFGSIRRGLKRNL